MMERLAGRLIASTMLLFLAACAVWDDPVTSVPLPVPDGVIQRALETQLSGQPLTWQLAGAGDLGTIEPLRTFRTKEGRFCREYEVTYRTNEGQDRRWVDVACRIEDGSWRQTISTASNQ